MEEVIFENFSKGKKNRGWHFRKVYPSMLNTNKNELSEIWISEERLKIPVGKQKVVILFFLWLKYNSLTRMFECNLGIVPEHTSLDDKALSILKDLTKGDFLKNPYYHLMLQDEFREIFLQEKDVKFDELPIVREQMEISVGIVERNLIYYLEGGLDRRIVKNNNGWAVLVRARSGSI